MQMKPNHRLTGSRGTLLSMVQSTECAAHPVGSWADLGNVSRWRGLRGGIAEHRCRSAAMRQRDEGKEAM